MPKLVTIPFSHFCEKARWALQHAGVAFDEEGHVPGMHRFAVQQARGRPGSVPVLVLDDVAHVAHVAHVGRGAQGGVLDDSPLIVRWADRRAPAGRKLLPPHDSPLYAEALALERQLDHELAPHIRRLAYFHLLPDRSLTLQLMAVGTPRLEHTLVRGMFPLLRLAMRRAMRIDAAGAARSRDKVRRTFDDVGRRLSDGRPYLLGDRFGVADLAFAAFAAPLLRPPEHPVGRPRPLEGLEDEVGALRETPAGNHALRMYREHRKAAALAA
jgi:glutathione S-transferase